MSDLGGEKSSTSVLGTCFPLLFDPSFIKQVFIESQLCSRQLGEGLAKNSALKNLTVKKGRPRETKSIKFCEAQKRKCLGEQSQEGEVAW